MGSELGETRQRVGTIGYDGGLHCDLRVTDLRRSLDWYADVLGFAVIHHVPEAGWAELQTPVPFSLCGISIASGPRHVWQVRPQDGRLLLRPVQACSL